MATSKVVLHHLEDSRSQRILWLLEELEVPYEIKKYKRTPEKRAPPELLEVNPLGKSPFITDGEVNLGESGAIVEYLIGKYGQGKFDPPENGRLDNLYFTHFAEGSLGPVLTRRAIFDIVPDHSPALVRPLIRALFQKVDQAVNVPEFRNQGKMIETHLEKSGDWFAGGNSPTSADFLMSFGMETFVLRSPESLGPKSKEYVERIQARPAYKRALEKGGEYAYVVKGPE
ncbi:thioredoxin-like protein [Pluteus cervinus]|uniref:Thioredoxin-like protein n=1 Tax=Pluteus cervinus TaxID=181527 RepID=A0ACD3AAV3_9AGAR|nr:thioredoxin-like protein [Pluteus cervinus]